MESREFEKIWALYRILYPSHHSLENENFKIVWEVALQPFSLDDVTASVMDHARKKKFFPNIAEITASLTPVGLPLEKQRKPYGDTSWMGPYIQANVAKITDEDADEIHAAGLFTWREAETAGTSFLDWNRKYWEKFPIKF